jgi:Carbohydrate esterase, sialic acid-specific acetylesterase
MKQLRIGLVLLVAGLVRSGAAAEVAKGGPEAKSEVKKPIRVILCSGQSNMVGHGPMEGVKKLRPDVVPARDDVWLVGASIPGKPLQGEGSGNNLGIHLTFGNKLGNALDEPVVFIKAAWDGRSLWEDFRPPSAVAKRGGVVGANYKWMMEGFARALQHWDDFLPELAGRRYEISGFAWFQGEADGNRGGKAVWEEYEANLKDLIHDIRTEFQVPGMPALIIQINDGREGVEPEKPNADGSYGGWHTIREAQRKVADDDPNAAWVLTLDQSPSLHYDTASYLNIGDRCGEKMLGLLKKEVRNDRDSAGVQAVIKKHVLDKIKPPLTEKPDMEALCKGLYGYFPFDGFVREMVDTSRGKREEDFLSGEAVQPVKGVVGNMGNNKKADLLVDGVCGKALQFRGDMLLHFSDFKEPVDEKGMLGNMTVSFWLKTNTLKGRSIRLGRGAGFRLPNGNTSWHTSWEANYAGWDFTPVGSHTEIAFTTSFECLGAMGYRTWGVNSTGVEWTHVVLMYDRQTGEKSIWTNGEKAGKPDDGRKVKSQDDSAFKGLGIIAANVPLAIGVQFVEDSDFCCFDELCMWQRTLTPEEIKALYNNGHGLALPKTQGHE